jgi:nicotinamide phosphoribosyltransferase
MKNILHLLTTIIRTDGYKLSQFLQYPAKTAYISSYIESRGGEDESVFFGIQAFIKDYMMSPITLKDIDFAEKIFLLYGEPFNRAGWEIILNEYEGYLPLEIEAVPEGTVMPTRNIQVQVINTDSRLAWLVSYVETAMLRGVWYPSTVATKSRKLKKVIAQALVKTSDIPVDEQIFFKLHDFGARGASSTETSVLGGMSHLVNFMGTDTIEGIVGAMTYYNAEVCGFSIPASEHSTITSWGRENEAKAYENMIDQFAGEGKIYACVSDSYNIYDAVERIWGKELKEKVINSGGTLVVRPDSGDPLTVPIEVVRLLMKQFGYTVNSKGFKVLPSCVRVIQGDGINEDSLPQLIDNMIAAGYSIDNIAFGMGGGLLQAWNRDTLKYAMKASARCDDDGVWHDVYKDPIDDKGKLSKKGRLGLVHECGVGSCSYRTVPKHIADKKGNIIRVIWRNGKFLIEDDFDTIRKRAELQEEEYMHATVERF